MNYINNLVNENIYKQSTLKKPVFFTGIGIHNGKAVSMSIEPSAPNTGITFIRTDLCNDNVIKATASNIDKSSLCTKITNKKGISVSTIEHLMAALSGMNIDNVTIKINSPELPALDGSSYDYITKIIKNGIITQNDYRKCIRVLKEITVCDESRFISIEPDHKLKIDITIDYPKTIIGNSNFKYEHSQSNFIRLISKARTFAFLDDVEKMRIAGYAMGGNINNAIVVDKFNIINPSSLRLDDEFVKHKTLDCIGDFYLLGMPLIGSVNCFAPGHKLNQKLVKQILNDKSNYRIETMKVVDETNDYKNLINISHHQNKDSFVA